MMDGSSRSGSHSVMITAGTASTLEYHNMFMIYLHKRIVGHGGQDGCVHHQLDWFGIMVPFA